MDNEKLEKISKKIDKLTKKEHIEIFSLLNDLNINYSENKNGIFIQMNQMTLEQLNKIEEYLDYKEKKEMDINKIEKTMELFKKDLNNNKHL
tara:strand:- start:121 stop:396 length:276 start_codon:yes stop_codon:yes gene_type:complete